jgi:hypothetical protein
MRAWLVCVAAACGGPPGPAPVSQLAITVTGDVSADVGPPLGPITLSVRLGVTSANGTITGSGRHDAYSGATLIESSTWRVDRLSNTDSTAHLEGVITVSSASGLVGSPWTLDGHRNGAITFVNGPIPGGPFAGKTQTFTGQGSVSIVRTASATP